MTQEGFKRKLTAILSADAVGYSRLMAEDEVATVKTIASYREIMATAVQCAVAVQKRNSDTKRRFAG